MKVTFTVLSEPPEPEPDDVEGWREDPDDCNHVWVAVGMTDYGTLYECSRCGGLTP